MASVLVTGAGGFLGRYVARCFQQHGYTVHGLGRGDMGVADRQRWGIAQWHPGDVTLDNLLDLNVRFDVVVHCAGGSSVARSYADPVKDFADTVTSTLQVLEFMRQHCPAARLVYPSSAAVYGEHDASQIAVTDALKPVSPYGLHKLLSEQLCQSYQRQYGLDTHVIRFFSVYGPGLKKQLLWDACRKMAGQPGRVEFWGTGQETRDWISGDDAAQLVFHIATVPDAPLVVNGGSGCACTIQATLEKLAEALGFPVSNIAFNGAVKAGDPRHYHADIAEAVTTGWQPRITLEQGLADYVAWFRQAQDGEH